MGSTAFFIANIFLIATLLFFLIGIVWVFRKVKLFEEKINNIEASLKTLTKKL